jgi:hypothetical protein
MARSPYQFTSVPMGTVGIDRADADRVGRAGTPERQRRAGRRQTRKAKSVAA